MQQKVAITSALSNTVGCSEIDKPMVATTPLISPARRRRL